MGDCVIDCGRVSRQGDLVMEWTYEDYARFIGINSGYLLVLALAKQQKRYLMWVVNEKAI